eukprot:12614896-Heterocapsa_arctica.AAC.1
MKYQPMVSAARQADGIGGMGNKVYQLTELTGWEKLAEHMRAMAYSTTSYDPWARLGVPQLEGAAPTQGMVEQRANFAILLTKIADGKEWTTDDRAEAKEFEKKVEEARAQCSDDLPRVLKERRRQKQEAPIPRWQEPSLELLGYLAKLTRPWPRRLAIHLSNLQGYDLGDYQGVSPVNECREIYDSIFKGQAKTTEFLGQLNNDELVLWAPADNNVFLNLLAAYH